jgi:hypothetical protein
MKKKQDCVDFVYNISENKENIILEKKINGFKVVSYIPKKRIDSEANFERFKKYLNECN